MTAATKERRSRVGKPPKPAIAEGIRQGAASLRSDLLELRTMAQVDHPDVPAMAELLEGALGHADPEQRAGAFLALADYLQHTLTSIIPDFDNWMPLAQVQTVAAMRVSERFARRGSTQEAVPSPPSERDDRTRLSRGRYDMAVDTQREIGQVADQLLEHIERKDSAGTIAPLARGMLLRICSLSTEALECLGYSTDHDEVQIAEVIYGRGSETAL